MTNPNHLKIQELAREIIKLATPSTSPDICAIICNSADNIYTAIDIARVASGETLETNGATIGSGE